jgi:hypothetical protein
MSSSAIRRAAPANPLTASPATAQVFALASNPVLPCTLAVPGKGALDGRRFFVRAEGSAFVAAGTTTVKATLLAALALPASPLVAANWTTIGAGTARAIATASYAPWWIEANLIYDSNGGLLQGSFGQLANNLIDAAAAITGTLTGINGTNVPVTQFGGTVVPPADPVCLFAVALTFGTAGANIGNLANFEIGF